MTAAVRFSTAWCMPSPWTFQMEPVRAFLARHLTGRRCIVDPFCGTSQIGHFRNDLGRGGVDAEDFLRNLIRQGVRADAVLFDPPYSPRQVAECYAGTGRKITMADTQNGAPNKRVKALLREILDEGGIALSFGWQSSGFGRAWETVEILLVQHGGAHNDTICVAQRPPRLPLFDPQSEGHIGEMD
ncbi:MAG: hypothetical protein A4C66_11885 [Nitrospira sp. HN-bin3]|nr:MAG: hypothetical protein A4C66_11885 [Nitrospira sp. HN-bin3]